jgi:hypothetical protein
MFARPLRALHGARQRRDMQAIASFWLGWLSVVLVAIGVLTHLYNISGVGFLSGIAAIVMARSARHRAEANDDPELVYLSRYGQVTGWLIVGLLGGALLVVALIVGIIIGALSHLS